MVAETTAPAGKSGVEEEQCPFIHFFCNCEPGTPREECSCFTEGDALDVCEVLARDAGQTPQEATRDAKGCEWGDWTSWKGCEVYLRGRGDRWRAVAEGAGETLCIGAAHCAGILARKRLTENAQELRQQVAAVRAEVAKAKTGE